MFAEPELSGFVYRIRACRTEVRQLVVEFATSQGKFREFGYEQQRQSYSESIAAVFTGTSPLMPIFAAEQFATLLREAREGSSSALGRLLEPFRSHLGPRHLSPGLQAHLDQSELVQDTFQAAIGNFASFRGSTEGELFAWLRQILRHRALNVGQRDLKTQKRAARPVSLDQNFAQGAWRDMLIDDNETPCTSSGSRELKAIMQRALLQLKPHYQEVITLHYGAEKTFADIAVLQNTTTEAVMKTWKRALKAWRRTMEEMGAKDW